MSVSVDSNSPLYILSPLWLWAVEIKILLIRLAAPHLQRLYKAKPMSSSCTLVTRERWVRCRVSVWCLMCPACDVISLCTKVTGVWASPGCRSNYRYRYSSQEARPQTHSHLCLDTHEKQTSTQQNVCQSPELRWIRYSSFKHSLVHPNKTYGLLFRYSSAFLHFYMS